MTHPRQDTHRALCVLVWAAALSRFGLKSCGPAWMREHCVVEKPCSASQKESDAWSLSCCLMKKKSCSAFLKACLWSRDDLQTESGDDCQIVQGPC